MKFFAEFGSCWGGASVTPAADSAEAPSRQKAAVSSKSQASRSSGWLAKVKTAHWKPALSAISEHSVVREIRSEGSEWTAARSRKKARSAATARSPTRSDNYRMKDSISTKLTAVIPIPILF